MSLKMQEGEGVENRLAQIGIFVEKPGSVEALNALLHGFASFIVGRMGLPLRERNISAISVVIDAPQDVINALTGKLGALEGVSAKTLFSKV